MEIIGLTGFARSGKDTAADFLVRDHGFIKRSFAAPLKQMLLTLNPIVGHRGWSIFFNRRDIRVQDLFTMYGDEDGIKASKYAKEYRRLLQVLGTDCIRKIDQDFWVKAAMKEIKLLPSDSRVVFTDVRFPNEAGAVIDNGGFTAQIHRPGVTRANGHSSERHVGKMNEDFVIDNSGSIIHLGSNLDHMIRVLGIHA